MKSLLSLSVSAALLVLVAASSGFAADETAPADAQPDTQAAGDEAMPPKVEGYTDTGESRNCIATYRIDWTKVIDNSTILFRLHGGDYYVNRLPHRCSGLKIEGGFGYSLRGLNELCNVDSITVISSIGPGARCLLGMFDEVTKDPKPADGAS